MDIELKNGTGEKLDHAFHPGAREDVLVVLAHGVTGNKDRPLLVRLAEDLSGRGWPCLRISFSGNGASGGSFEEATITKEAADLAAVLDQVAASRRLAYVGHSMGAAVGALVAARDERISVLVSLAGMVKTRDFYEREFGGEVAGAGVMWDDPACPLSEAFRDDLQRIGDTLGAVREVRVPWLFVHGDADDVVPPEDSREAFAAARGAKRQVEIPGAGHALAEDPAAVTAAVHDWLERHLP